MSWETRTREAFRIQRQLRALALGFLLGAALLLAGCCSSDRCRAVTTANLMHDTGDVAADVIDRSCTQRYQAAQDAATVEALGKACHPAADAFRAFRVAHAALVARLAAGDSLVGAALAAAQAAASALAASLGALR